MIREGRGYYFERKRESERYLRKYFGEKINM
jgi:hypothetical protein